ncbi:MAG: pantothenate kinase [Eubacteriales bacterium]|nr:pantothenate kinase [Eubacteriales bacterium]
MRDKAGIVLGLDIGGSSTKAAAFSESSQLESCHVTASDPLSSAYGALGRFLFVNNLAISELSRIVLTGVGSAYLKNPMFGVPTYLCAEFQAVALGGLYAAKKERAIVVSMGTGTSIVLGDKEAHEHIIGSGVGGGTLLGLSQALLKIREFDSLNELAASGELSHVDLTVGDLTPVGIPGLSKETTAANFGKLTERASEADLAAGLINLVFQSLGTAAILSAKVKNCETIVFIGSLAKSRAGQRSLKEFAKLYNKEIIIPEEPEFATARGAALAQRDLQKLE